MLKNIIVPTNNLSLLGSAYERLAESSLDSPKFGLIKGTAGYGKSTGLTWLSTRCNGVSVVASPLWTPREMLKNILDEIGIPAAGSNQAMVAAIVTHLGMSGRPLFIDDTDYIFDCTNSPTRIIETFRYIHDQAGVPVLLVGMDKIDRKIARREQLSSRIKEVVEFTPMNDRDARTVADALLTDVHCDDELLGDLLGASRGGIRRFQIGLSQIGRVARQRGATQMTLPLWQQAGLKYFL
jgi:DNA transposition AAA+ family ATPase